MIDTKIVNTTFHIKYYALIIHYFNDKFGFGNHFKITQKKKRKYIIASKDFL